MDLTNMSVHQITNPYLPTLRRALLYTRVKTEEYPFRYRPRSIAAEEESKVELVHNCPGSTRLRFSVENLMED